MAWMGMPGTNPKKATARETIARVPRICVVDDDPIFCRAFAKMAESRGWSVTECTNLSRVLHQKNQPCDVVVLDYLFGELTAVQIADVFGPEAAVVLVSGTTPTNLPRDVPSFRWEAFVHKQQGLPAVVDAVASLLPKDDDSSGSSGQPRPERNTLRSWVGLMLVWSTALVGAVALRFFQ